MCLAQRLVRTQHSDMVVMVMNMVTIVVNPYKALMKCQELFYAPYM